MEPLTLNLIDDDSQIQDHFDDESEYHELDFDMQDFLSGGDSATPKNSKNSALTLNVGPKKSSYSATNLNIQVPEDLENKDTSLSKFQ
jgi:hypothetical protein